MYANRKSTILEKLKDLYENNDSFMTIPGYSMHVATIAKEALNKITSLTKEIENIESLPSCVDCTKNGCNYRPGPGESLRYNCPGHEKESLSLSLKNCKRLLLRVYDGEPTGQATNLFSFLCRCRDSRKSIHIDGLNVDMILFSVSREELCSPDHWTIDIEGEIV